MDDAWRRQVYLVRDSESGHQFALKKMKMEKIGFKEASLERLAMLAARADSPNVVTLLGTEHPSPKVGCRLRVLHICASAAKLSR